MADIMRYIFLFILVAAQGSCSGTPPKFDRILVAVKRNYTIPKKAETVTVHLKYSDLTGYLPQAATEAIRITDSNFGKRIEPKYIDANNDKSADYLSFEFTFESNEPVFAFLLTPAKENHVIVKEKVVLDSRLEVSYLTPFLVKNGKNEPYPIAKKLVQSSISRYPDTRDFPIYNPGKWNYEYGFFFTGCYRLGKELGNEPYISYARKWMDDFVEPQGFREGVYAMDEYKLDDILPGRLAILLFEKTKSPQYKVVADTLRVHLLKQPKTSDGGYWHKKIYPYQMWLDGIFMADVFSMQYADAFDEPQLFDEAAHQIKLIYNHTVDPVTGLLYHGWDESKNPVWADPDKGTSPEFWGRAMGWFVMALVECLDYLPKDHPDREEIISILRDVATSVAKYQDEKTGLWYQVLDKGAIEGNWIETSCSAMFAYAFAKGNRIGVLENSFRHSAQRAFDSLLNNYVYTDKDGNLHLDQTVKIGTLNTKTSKGDFDYYVTTERRLDDYKGLASLLFASIELKR
jgi:unsaturated rhamnogalacturonyl hydrolase